MSPGLYPHVLRSNTHSFGLTITPVAILDVFSKHRSYKNSSWRNAPKSCVSARLSAKRLDITKPNKTTLRVVLRRMMGARLRSLTLRNFGPVSEGTIEIHNVNVFFGPNSSGKSMVARLIHGVARRAYTAPFRESVFSEIYSYYSPSRSVAFGTQEIMRMVSEYVEDIPTIGRREASVAFKTARGEFAWKISGSGEVRVAKGGKTLHNFLRDKRSEKSANVRLRPSVYVPAARAGTIQFFNTVIQILNRLYRDVLRTFGRRRLEPKTSLRDLRRTLRNLGRFPRYLEDFYDLILEFLSEGITKGLSESFQSLHYGKLRIKKAPAMPSLSYVDPSGFSTEVERASSGVIASFPILLGLYKVVPGGLFIVEEPELDLEPSGQMKMVELICRVAQERKLTVVLTTHSDYVVKKLLALVSRGEIRSKDLGLHFFQRPRAGFTRIREIEVDPSGEAEQPLFQEAIESLVREFSGTPARK